MLCINNLGKVFACITFFALRDLFRCACADDTSALGAAFRSQIDYMVCGQNYGARKYKRVISGLYRGLAIMFIFSAIMLPIMQFGGDNIVRIFVEDADVIAMGSRALRITSWFYAFLGIIYVTRGVLNGIGDAFFALLNGIVEILCRLLIPLPMTSIPALGVWGIWWSVGVTWTVSAVTALMRYAFVKRKKNLAEKTAEP